MTSRSAKFSGIALTALAMAVALSGCNTINHFRNKDDGPVAVASQGQRISIVAFEQKLEPSKSLKGVGYYLPPVQPVADWPVGSGPAGDLIQNADSAKAFSIAWVKSIGLPSKITLPRVGRTTPMIVFMVVDLPDALPPSRATISPFSIE